LPWVGHLEWSWLARVSGQPEGSDDAAAVQGPSGADRVVVQPATQTRPLPLAGDVGAGGPDHLQHVAEVTLGPFPIIPAQIGFEGRGGRVGDQQGARRIEVFGRPERVGLSFFSADTTAFYALPEGQRGIFVGGGATVRVGRIVGAGRLIEMMLTGRSYDAAEGQRLGLSHYLVEPGTAFEKAVALAERIAGNAMLSNYAILNAIPRIEDMAMKDGLFTESLMAALAQTGEEAGERLRAFLERRSERVRASPLPEGEVDSAKPSG